MIELKYVVHHVQPCTAGAVATVKGESIPATIDALRVELVSDVATSITFVVTGTQDIAEAVKKFVVGEVVTWKL